MNNTILSMTASLFTGAILTYAVAGVLMLRSAFPIIKEECKKSAISQNGKFLVKSTFVVLFLTAWPMFVSIKRVK